MKKIWVLIVEDTDSPVGPFNSREEAENWWRSYLATWGLTPEQDSQEARAIELTSPHAESHEGLPKRG